jgi:ribose transport system permease protein
MRSRVWAKLFHAEGPTASASGLLLLLAVAFAVLTPATFLTGPNLSNVARQASFDAIIAIGLMVVMIGGGLDISVGSVMSMSAALVMGFQPSGVVVAVVIALAFGCLVGLVNGFVVVHLGIVPFIATLGSMTIVGAMVHAYSDSAPIPGTNESFGILGNGNIGPIPVPFVFLVGVALIAWFVLTQTAPGRAVFAIGGNPEAAASTGIKSGRVVVGTYVISGFCAALSGVLLASALNTSSPQLGRDTPLFVLAAVIIGGASIFGGRGSVLGAVLGIFGLTVLANGMNGIGIESAQQTIVRASVFLVVVMVDAVSIRIVRTRRLRRRARQDQTFGPATPGPRNRELAQLKSR